MPTATKKSTSKRVSVEHRPGFGKTECEFCGLKQCDFSCDESQAGGFQTSPAKPRKRRLRKPPTPAIYHLGECGQAWEQTQLHNRVKKLQEIGASAEQVAALAPRHFYQLSKWARLGLKDMFRRERLAKKGA